uniref:hypothetical protein n=1 Tax=Pedobacter schmidteae TaxID=2201271 RepID=UPI000EAB4DDD|nr:hypothetical protein [Pedobacter schmidteae]
MKIKVLIFFLLFIGVKSNAQLIENLRANAKSWANAQSEKNADSLAKYTYPPFVANAGGKEKWIATTTELWAKSRENKNWTPRRIAAEEPGNIVQAGDDLHCIVPIEIVFELPKRGYFSKKSYLLAASSDKGSSWTFAELTEVRDDNRTAWLKRWFPNFNNQLTIPSAKRAVFHQKKG